MRTYVTCLRIVALAVVTSVLTLALLAASDGEAEPWEVLEVHTR